jgi:putative DNA primase/helicase
MTIAEKVIQRFQGVKRSGQGKWMARCPAHDDRQASLSVGEGTEGGAVLHCHAGCETSAVVAAVGLGLADLMPSSEMNGTAKHRPTVSARYAYHDEQGVLLYEVLRTAPKGFTQRRPNPVGGWIPNLTGVRRVLYRFPELLAADHTATLYVCEGEKDVEAVRALGLVATTNAGGAGKWRREYNEPLRGRRVVVLPDNDDPGRAHAQHVAASLKDIAAEVRVLDLPGLPAKGDVSDWIASGGTAEKLRELCAPRAIFTMVPFSAIEAKEVPWFWPGRIPAAMLSVFDGEKTAGKTAVMMDLSARTSTGRPWPASVGRREPQHVIFLGHEDAGEYTLRPRLNAAGADPHRVHLLTEFRGRWPEFPRDADALEAAVESVSAAAVIIDPISAYLGGTDLHRDNEIRGALMPLAEVARRTGAAIILVRHVRKAGGVSAIHRGIGSVAIGNVARNMMMLLREPDDEETRILTWPALNVGPQPKSLRWRYGSAPADRVPPVEWDDLACDWTADQILDRKEGVDRKPSRLERAVEWLRTELGDGQRVPSLELKRRGEAAGHAEKTMQRAREQLAVESQPDGRTRVWYSWLPIKTAKVAPTNGDGRLGHVGHLGGEQDSQDSQEGQGTTYGPLGSLAPVREPGEDDDDVPGAWR